MVGMHEENLTKVSRDFSREDRRDRRGLKKAGEKPGKA
jgi:hypothetical protein